MGFGGNEMFTKLLKKGLVCGIIVLFFCMNMLSISGSLSKEKHDSTPSSIEKLITIQTTGPGDVNWTVNGTMGNNGWYISPITLTCTYDHDSIAYIYYQYNDNDWEQYTGPFTIYAQGGITLDWYAVDYEGNVLPPRSISFIIDYTPPVIELTVEKIGLTKWLFSVIAYDNISGLINVEFYLDGLFLGNVTTIPFEWIWEGSGSHTVQAIAYDAAGNSAASAVVNSVPQNENQPGGQQFSIDSSYYNSMNIVHSIKNIGTTTYDGTLEGYVTDSEMNPIQGARVQVYFHNTYVKDYTNAKGNYYTTNIPLCHCLKNVICSKFGYYTESVWLNITDYTTYDFVLTPLPIYPELSGTMGENGWFVSAVTVSFVGNGFINHSYYALDESPWTEYIIPFPVDRDGEHFLHWFWVDKQGNTSGVNWIGFKIDQHEPSIDLVVKRIWFRTWDFTANATDSFSGVKKVEFYIDNNLVGTDTNPPYEMIWRGWRFGKIIKTIAYDNAGNSAMTSIHSMSMKPRQRQSQNQPGSQQFSTSASGQTTVPVVPWTKNIGTTAYHGTLSGYVTDSEMNPIEGARIRVYFHDTYSENYSDSTGYYHVTDIPLCACPKNTTCLKLGYYTEYVWLTNNESTTHDFVLTPMPIYAVPSGKIGENEWFISAVTVTLTGNGSSNHSYCALDEGSWTEYVAPFVVVGDGEHFLHWFWVDDQGNSSDVYWVGFKMDTIKPEWINYTCTPLNLLKTKWLCVANVTDATSGISLVEFYVDEALVGNDTTAPYEFQYNGKPHNFSNAIAYDDAGNSALCPIIIPIIPQHSRQNQNQQSGQTVCQQNIQLLHNLIYNLILCHQTMR